jgi:hypothetical protein
MRTLSEMRALERVRLHCLTIWNAPTPIGRPTMRPDSGDQDAAWASVLVAVDAMVAAAVGLLVLALGCGYRLGLLRGVTGDPPA